MYFLLLIVLSIITATKWTELDSYHFGMYKQEFNKVYLPQERSFRQYIFQSNLKRIIQHNQDKTQTWKAGVNQFTDRTPPELKAYLGNKVYPKHIVQTKRNTGDDMTKNIDKLIDVPENMDWRDYGIITAVKNQGRCGSCYSFSTAQAVESYHALATGHLEILSEQQILSCIPNPRKCGGTGGCGGSTEVIALKGIIEMGGLSSEWTYPYTSYFGENFNCNKTLVKPVVKVRSYVELPTNNYETMVRHIATKGPLAISVDASDWSMYESGVFNSCNQTNPDLNHAVQLVGFGNTTKEGSYWIVRNSWGPEWGENGYIRLFKSPQYTCGTDVTPWNGDACEGDTTPIEVCGTCGVLYSAVYPIL